MYASPNNYVDALKAVGQTTRLRVLALLRQIDLSVGELAQILRLSQPRLSNHLKILASAGLIERLPEGSWVFYRIQSRGWAGRLLQDLFSGLDLATAPFNSDDEALQDIRQTRAKFAESYFSEIANDWDHLRALHYPETAIEQAILGYVKNYQFERVVDLGTGTGRMLILLGHQTMEAEGLDISHNMLTVARTNLNRAGINNARVRYGDAMNTPFKDNSTDLVIIHQVLHYLDQPEKVLVEAARILKPGGQLLIVDFAPHDMEYLRETQGHRRLGISEDDLRQWTDTAGLFARSSQIFDPPESLKQGLSVFIWNSSKCIKNRGIADDHQLAITTQQSTSPPNVSFEFFPPKTDKMEAKLWESVARLSPLSPRFVSVTYGAGGSTQNQTQKIVSMIAQDTSLIPAAHLTCVGATKKDVLKVASRFWKIGVRHIVALRGDPPEGLGSKFVQFPDGFKNSVELIQGIRSHEIEPGARFEISVSCYPEQHPESLGWDQDIEFLRAKQDAGADRAITQFFFEPDTYFSFLDRARAGCVTMPIIPGIMLQPNFEGLQRIAKLCQVDLPDWLYTLYTGTDQDESTRELITANVAAELCQKLIEQGVNDFHFYTLNRASLAVSICRLLGLKPN